jgi:hypothetical protein
MDAPYIFFFVCFWHATVSQTVFTSVLQGELTSKVIHEMGSSSGIAVLFISFKLSASSSNSKVKMAPGGVQVPTIK